jgi:hypothetical protein
MKGMVCIGPCRNSGILSLEEERKFYFFHSGYVTNWYQSMVTTLGLHGLMHELHKEVLLSTLLRKEKDCKM